MAKKTEEVVIHQDPGALAALDFGDHAGQGKKNMTSADQAIPFLSVLQALSKVISDPTKKIKGAEAGMLMDSVSKQLYDGEEGVVFIPCNTARVFVEWQGEPGSGTVVGRFGPSDPQVKAAEKKFSFNKLQTTRGNRLVETFYVIGMVLPSPDAVVPSGFAVLACKSTMIKPYKESIGVLRTLPGNAPLYAFKLRLRTKAETRPKGTSYNLVIMPDGYDGNVFKDGVMGCVIKPDSEQAVLYKLALQLAQDFDNGAANIAYDTEGSHGGDGEAGSENEPY
jgi:hypothetical protein